MFEIEKAYKKLDTITRITGIIEELQSQIDNARAKTNGRFYPESDDEYCFYDVYQTVDYQEFEYQTFCYNQLIDIINSFEDDAISFNETYDNSNHTELSLKNYSDCMKDVNVIITSKYFSSRRHTFKNAECSYISVRLELIDLLVMIFFNEEQ